MNLWVSSRLKITNKMSSSVQAPGEGLLVDLDERRTGRPTGGAAVAAQWFAQPIFGGADLEDEEEESETLPSTSGRQLPQAKPAATATADKAELLAKPAATTKPAKQSGAAIQQQAGAAVLPSQHAGQQTSSTEAAVLASDTAEADGQDVFASSSSDAGDSSDDDASMPDAARLQSNATAGPSSRNKSGFEEVPVSRQHAKRGAADSDESSDDGFSDLDDDGKAEVLALAKKMLRGRDRQDILDGAYHKYAFHESGLPDWFQADERRHMK